MSKLKTVNKYNFGELSIFDNFIIAVIKEGVNLTIDDNESLIDVAEKYFKNRPFAYITNRIYSYSVNPKIYLETSKIENLVAFAVVSQNNLSISNAEFEKQFLTKPHKSFNKLIDAINWCEEKIAEASKE
ncbi:hypothetical protein [Planktosalinus lacus]|uniref:STAS/SEC14 domain-containing protein n=1 Tax=Planktosalinus lacus TaxID=1526573 RepID=A0A8J2YAQ0_9FLAO|nr:hypothetical protein [Planktosalinus lacus]GGD94621.1 hypothetical protein GCM10011312_17890 [Planktosalinus lacus]